MSVLYIPFVAFLVGYGWGGFLTIFFNVSSTLERRVDYFNSSLGTHPYVGNSLPNGYVYLLDIDTKSYWLY